MALNRAGMLSPNQIQRLETAGRSSDFVHNQWLVAGLIIALTIGLAFILPELARYPVIGLGVVILIGVLWLNVRAERIGKRSEIEAAAVLAWTGHARAQLVSTEYTSTWMLYIDSMNFVLPSAQAATMIRDGERYTVYFTPKTKKIVAIQPAAEHEAAPKAKRQRLELGDDGELIEAEDKPKRQQSG